VMPGRFRGVWHRGREESTAGETSPASLSAETGARSRGRAGRVASEEMLLDLPDRRPREALAELDRLGRLERRQVRPTPRDELVGGGAAALLHDDVRLDRL